MGYEMWVRELETRVFGIVGASGCLYAIRRALHMSFLPDVLSRDFGAALVAREEGYRAVSVPAATCYVPRSASRRRDYARKVRTMVRGIETLWYKRVRRCYQPPCRPSITAGVRSMILRSSSSDWLRTYSRS